MERVYHNVVREPREKPRGQLYLHRNHDSISHTVCGQKATVNSVLSFSRHSAAVGGR